VWLKELERDNIIFGLFYSKFIWRVFVIPRSRLEFPHTLLELFSVIPRKADLILFVLKADLLVREGENLKTPLRKKLFSREC